MSKNSDKVYRLLYKSTAIATLTQKDVTEIVAHSESNNRKKGISGFLVFENRQFMQLLEGEESVVKALYYEKIAKDNRHQDVTVLKEGHGARMCAEWSMSQLPIGLFEAQFNVPVKKRS
jgi:hypothetical protein